jgi:hypothetical protein
MDCPVCLAESQRDEALARADRLADRAVMLESLVARQEAQLAEITRLLKPWRRVAHIGDPYATMGAALAVAEGES